MMMKQLSRRTVLRGLGATVALPFLDAMFPTFAAQSVKAALRPTRMAFLYVPNGIVMEDWTPPGELGSTPLGELPRISRALAPYRDDLLFLSGLTSDKGRAHGDGPGDHGRAGAAYLTGVHPKKTSGKDLRAGVSMDQIAAERIGSATKYASLEIGCEEGIQGGNCDNGYSCAYSNSLSWRTPSTPNPPEVRPRAVFERLFGAVDDERDPEKRRRQRGYDKSVLDAVLDDAQSLKNRLGGTDRSKVDEYLFAVRDIEKRIEQAERSGPDQLLPPIEAPAQSVPADFGVHGFLMMDLLTLAFQTDQTRIVTALMGIEQSPRNYPEIGITEGHHGLTHHQGNPEKIEKVRQINEYHLKQFTYLLDKMKSTNDGDGTVRDHSMIIYGSALSDGNAHPRHHLPTVVAGRANGTLPPGRHLRYELETSLTNLFISTLDRMGVPVDQFGDSNGRLMELSDL
jgi:hypothetical protein